MQVTDRPSPDAPSLTQAIIVQRVYCKKNARYRCRKCGVRIQPDQDLYVLKHFTDKHQHSLKKLPERQLKSFKHVFSPNLNFGKPFASLLKVIFIFSKSGKFSSPRSQRSHVGTFVELKEET